MAQRAPKQWQLTKEETITSYESWRQNLLYVLSLDPLFARFLVDGVKWGKKTTITPMRGLTNDTDSVPQDHRLTAARKNQILDLMLGQIANFCPVIARNTIVKNSTSLDSIWAQIRQHYGFQASGARFLDLASIKLEAGEKPEDLFQRLQAFFQDNLLTASGGINHCGETPEVDEDMTPTLENTIVCLWLQMIRPNLPNLVKQKYGAELRNQTLASLRPEISTALDSLIEELAATEEAKVLRTFTGARNAPPSRQQTKTCTLCKAAKRPSYNTHFLSECKHLPTADRRAIARARLSQDACDEECDVEAYVDECVEDQQSPFFDQPEVRRVNIVQSPFIYAFFQDQRVRLTLDSGATTNMVRSSVAKHIGLPVKPASQMAQQADGCTPLAVVGETHCVLSRGSRTFQLDALVVDKLDVDFLAGSPFMDVNDIGIRIAKRQIIIGGQECVHYNDLSTRHAAARRTQSFVIRAPKHQTVILPGEYVEAEVPADCTPDVTWALQPRYDSRCNQDAQSAVWPPPQEVEAVDHHIRIVNTSSEPILLKKGEHFGQVNEVFSATAPEPTSPVPEATQTEQRGPPADHVVIDPDNMLPQAIKDEFKKLHSTYSNVFNPTISKYNGASGNIEGNVNMGPVLPPQRKGRLPSYNRTKLIELQQKFDELEKQGVFAKPEQVGVSVEYLNLSFLVQKPSGGSRLVTAFGEVGQYAKPQPSLMPNVDGTLRDIARWKYLVTSDLLKSFYQIPLSKSSMRFCGVVTPFKGVRVYTRCAMGMPGSETCLEELMSRVLGELVQEGVVAKLADDLYCGGNTPDELLKNWGRVLEAIAKNNLRLSASKTVVSPKTASILGWVWSQGTLRTSSHRTAALAAVTPPPTVHGLRSFIGAYKVLSRVLKGYAELLHPLDQAVAGRQSREEIQWSDELLHAFKQAQDALKNTRTITLPRPEDELWIVTDGSVKNRGIGATLYVLRDNSLLLAGFFNAKLKKHQVTWLPCEVEALCIGAAIRHYAPFSIQSHQPTQVLTDSRPCVQAYQKLCRGEFSNSSRVTSFLSMLSRYQARLSHISGAANLASDYASRNPIECDNSSCQVCKFIAESQEVVRSVSVQDVIDGVVTMPFSNRPAWKATQMECKDLRRVHSHLTQGTRPNKKITTVQDVKRYLKSVTIAADGVLVVRLDRPFQDGRERIVLPRSAVHGLVTAVHLKFSHPSAHQMKKLLTRYFYALDFDGVIQTVVKNCHQCESLKLVPNMFREQTTSSPPERVGFSFATDVMRRCKQMILVLRETVSSYTLSCFIRSEKHDDLVHGILSLAASVRPLGDQPMVMRTDNAPGFQTMAQNPVLAQKNIRIELGRVKNINKNPVAERAIEELGREILHIAPDGGAISELTLALATANLNSRIRKCGLSAREVWTQRDQVSGEQLPIQDRELILEQHNARQQNHHPSAISKSHGKGKNSNNESFRVGDLVYLIDDRTKTKAREKYMIVQISSDRCTVRKFTTSQFRTRQYEVPLASVYHVHPTILPGPHNEHQDLEEHSDQDDDSDIDSTPTDSDVRDRPDTQDHCSTTPNIDADDVTDHPTELSHDTRAPEQASSYHSKLMVPAPPSPVQALLHPPEPTDPQPRRSKRSRAPPDRFRPEDWRK